MFTGIRTAITYFGLGLVAGVLLAPRTGDATRALLIARARDAFTERIREARQAAGDRGDPGGDPDSDGLAPEGAGSPDSAPPSTA